MCIDFALNSPPSSWSVYMNVSSPLGYSVLTDSPNSPPRHSNRTNSQSLVAMQLDPYEPRAPAASTPPCLTVPMDRIPSAQPRRIRSLTVTSTLYSSIDSTSVAGAFIGGYTADHPIYSRYSYPIPSSTDPSGCATIKARDLDGSVLVPLTAIFGNGSLRDYLSGCTDRK